MLFLQIVLVQLYTVKMVIHVHGKSSYIYIISVKSYYTCTNSYTVVPL